MKRTVLLVTIASLYVLYVAWLASNHLLLYRRVIFDVPIRFEDGYSLRRTFTVDRRGLYWLGVRYDDDAFQITANTPVPPDEFRVEFEVKSKGQVLTTGGTAGDPEWRRPWILNKGSVTRLVGPFAVSVEKEPYELSVRLSHVAQRIASKTPIVTMIWDWKQDPSYTLRDACLIVVGAAIAVALLASGYRALRSRRENERYLTKGNNGIAV